MPVIPIDVTAETVFNMSRVLLNDVNIQLWSDTVLMPMMYQAHLELQQKLKARASPVMKGYAYVTVDQYETFFPPGGGPVDLTMPIFMWERPYGSTVEFQPMTEAGILPFLAPGTNPNLIWWSWIQDTVQFVGASLIVEAVLLYWRRVPVPTVASDLIGIIDGEQYLAPRIAAIAAASVGEVETATQASTLAESQLNVVLSANKSRSPQVIATSFRP